MSLKEHFAWERKLIDDQPVHAAETGDVRVVFGIGPATAIDSPHDRMDRLLIALAPQIIGLRWGQQIHGRLVASLAAENGQRLTGARCVGRCDALVTADDAVGLVVWTADCVPILLEGDGVIAAVHSGWRGAAADIIGAVIDRFRLEFGVAPSDLRVAIGPAISGPSYPVGDEVVSALKRLDVVETRWLEDNHVDLRAFLGGRIEALGVPASAIETVAGCTASTPELASYRRDGALAGRQWSLIYRTRAVTQK